MASTRDIQRRIKSVGNTKKITKAMEMVAAAKMRKAVEAVLRTRTYAHLSWSTVLNVSRSLNSKDGFIHPLLSKKDVVKKVGIILITSNRGLCGGFNTAILNKAHQSVEKHKAETDFILIGKKGEAAFHYHHYNIAADFHKNDIALEIAEIASVAKMVISDFLSGKYDKVMVAYTDFVNASKQIPRVKQILPIEMRSQDEFLGIVEKEGHPKTSNEFPDTKDEYIFEPSPKEVLDEMIPRLIEVQLYQALLESNASEHSARMSAMHQATDAAGDMVDELTLFYNKARQASITAEIAEISAGANALKK